MSIRDTYIRAALDLWGQSQKRTVLPVHGRSMAPLFSEGDQTLLDYDITRIRFGDVLVFRQGETLVIHRVLRIIRKGRVVSRFITKGDNNIFLDAPVQPVNVIGRAVSIQRANQVIWLESFLWRMAGWVAAALGRAMVACLGMKKAGEWTARHASALLYFTTFPLRIALLFTHPSKTA